MEIWFKTDKQAVRLPVLPQEVHVNNSNITNAVNILKKGDINVFGGNITQSGEIASFFPNHEYSFNEYGNVENPFKLAMTFKDWSNLGQLVRFIVTDSKNGININFRTRITNFEYYVKDSTGDIYYNLKWKEFRPVEIKKINSSSSNNSNSNANNNPKQDTSTEDKKEANKQKTYTVNKGDSLWAIAQKHYGKGSDYPKIKNANTSKYPSLKKNNIIYTNWILVIP